MKSCGNSHFSWSPTPRVSGGCWQGYYLGLKLKARFLSLSVIPGALLVLQRSCFEATLTRDVVTQTGVPRLILSLWAPLLSPPPFASDAIWVQGGSCGNVTTVSFPPLATQVPPKRRASVTPLGTSHCRWCFSLRFCPCHLGEDW